MKFYIDTEFSERPGTIDLISIGIVCENGATFYAESTSFNPEKCNPWVKENVLTKLKFPREKNLNGPWTQTSSQFDGAPLNVEILAFNGYIADQVKKWISNCILEGYGAVGTGYNPQEEKIEFWGYYCD